MNIPRVNKWTLSAVKASILEIHGDVVSIDESTFINYTTRCRFVDAEYGAWCTKPVNVIARRQGHRLRSVSKAKSTFIRKYGVDNPSKVPAIKDKSKQTCISRYGVDNPALVGEFAEKARKTSIERFGVPHALQCDEVMDRVKATNIERYGFTCPLQNTEIHAIAVETLLTNFGVSHCSQSKDIRNRAKETCLIRFGSDNPAKSNVIKERVRAANMLKYGGPSSMNDHDVAKRNASSQTRAVKLLHWSTGEELVCVGSYEVKVVQYLNANQIPFQWQPQTFKMPPLEGGKAKTYRPDLYLTDAGVWVEIKGYFRKDAQSKWDWFHSAYPNSMLWNKEALKDLGLL